MWKIIVSYLLAKYRAFIAWVRKEPSVAIALLTLIVALLALIVSVYSMHLLRQDFIATHRPYVYAISKETDPNTVFISCFNAPARIISEEFYYLVVTTKENGEEDTNQIYKYEFPSGIVYPYIPPTRRLTILYDVKKKALELDPRIIRRKVKIDYKELSSDRTYFFEGNWDYNSVHDLWEDKEKFGN